MQAEYKTFLTLYGVMVAVMYSYKILYGVGQLDKYMGQRVVSYLTFLNKMFIMIPRTSYWMCDDTFYRYVCFGGDCMQ
jgi:hypothetical protein